MEDAAHADPPRAGPSRCSTRVPSAAFLLGCIILGGALYRRRSPSTRSGRSSSLVPTIRYGGLIAIASIALYGAALRGDRNVGTLLGVISLAGFFWLALSGAFSFGSIRRADWVALAQEAQRFVGSAE